MSKLQELTQFLKAHLPERLFHQEFASEMDSIEYLRAHKVISENQYQLQIQRYSAVISWGRFPYRDVDAGVIGALIEAFLAEHLIENEFYPQIELTEPTMDVDIIDDEVAIVVIEVQLYDPVVLIEDENGIIPLNGKKWRLDKSSITFAEEWDLVTKRGDDEG